MKRFLATILTVFTLFSMAAMPVTAFASGPDDNGVSVISSDYLSSYNVYAKKGSSSGKMDVTFMVRSPVRATKIGVSQIEICKASGAHVTTIFGSTSNGLLAANTTIHGATYTFTGTPGTEYIAKVTLYAADSSGSDSRLIITNSVTV